MRNKHQARTVRLCYDESGGVQMKEWYRLIQTIMDELDERMKCNDDTLSLEELAHNTAIQRFICPECFAGSRACRFGNTFAAANWPLP